MTVRPGRCVGVVAALAAAFLFGGVPSVRTEAPPPVKPGSVQSAAPAKAESRLEQIQAALNARVTLDKDIDATLKDALAFLSDRYDLAILVDTEAFKADLQRQEVEAQRVKLARGS